MNEQRTKVIVRCNYRKGTEAYMLCRKDRQGSLYATERQYKAACERIRSESQIGGEMSTYFYIVDAEGNEEFLTGLHVLHQSEITR